MTTSIIATSTPFAFGPTGTLLSVVENLADAGCEVEFHGSGPALALAAQSAGIRCVELGEGTAGARRLARRIADADIVVSSMDPLAAALGHRLGTPVVWLESLSWWSAIPIPDAARQSALFVRQRSLDVGESPEWPSYGRRQLVVGPIVDSRFAARPRSRDERRLLINLGGLSVPNFGGGDVEGKYVALIGAMIDELDLSGFDRIVLAANLQIVGPAAARFAAAGVEISCLSHRAFLETLSGADVLLTSPGLAAPLEGWTYGVPVAFLPPGNPSQHLQLAHFCRLGLTRPMPALGTVSPAADPAAEVRRMIDLLTNDEARRTGVLAALQEFLADADLQRASVARGNTFVQRLGPHALSAVTAAILELADDHN